MDALKQAIQALVQVSDEELAGFLAACYHARFSNKTYLTEPGYQPNEVYFITQGIVRVMLLDPKGLEHTKFFAQEGQFIADYASFLTRRPSQQYIQALSELECIVLPRSAIEAAYENSTYGDRLGRRIAEGYFVYQDQYSTDSLTLTPAERYASITQVFPDIHNRVPQHMIASYLGISSVHLSRLKREQLSGT